MNYLNAFASVNKMNTNEILAQRFYRFFKYTRNVALIAFIVFFILNAINTGNSILYWICYMFNDFYCRSNAISFVVCSFQSIIKIRGK